MRYHFTFVRMATIKMAINTKFWIEYGGKGKLPILFWWQCKLVLPLWGTVQRFLKKLKIELPYDTAISFLDMLLLLSRFSHGPTLCDPIDTSPPGSSTHRILQARILEWVAISFSASGHMSGLKPWFKRIHTPQCSLQHCLQQSRHR